VSIERSATRRIRRTPEAAREAAVVAARELLLAEGPGAVTLKAVAARIGTGHANLLHHFGSAAGLQTALMEAMIRDTSARVAAAVSRVRTGEGSACDLVDLVFEAFGAQGIGRLTAWLVSTAETDRLRPLFGVLRDLLRTIEADAVLPPDEARRRIADITLLIVLTGLGDSLIGSVLHETVDRHAGRGRELVAETLAAMMAEAS